MSLLAELSKASPPSPPPRAHESRAAGSVTRARLVPVDGAPEVPLNFNPASLRMRKKLRINESAELGQDQGLVEFNGGRAWELDLPDLIFDTYESKQDVRQVWIARLESLIYVDPRTGAPPLVRFVWGGFRPTFAFVVSAMDVEYSMFLWDGTPVRANVRLSLKSYEPPAERQDVAGQTVVGMGTEARVRTLAHGETIHQLAHEAYGDAAAWRKIAQHNGIDDPLGVKPGTRLVLPPAVA
jgi:hypothetical protein